MKKFYLVSLLGIFSVVCYSQCIPTIGWTSGPGGQITFTGNASGGIPPYSYEWYLGDTNAAFTQNTVHTYPYNATYRVCLLVTDAFSCWDSVCTDVQVTTAALSALCPGDAAFTTTANNEVITFSAATGSNLVIIDFGDGSFAGWGGLTHTYQLNGTYQVTAISVQNFNGLNLTCDTSVQMVNVTTVPCQSNFTLDSDTSDYMIYAYNTSLGDVNCTWSVNGVPVASNVNTYFSGVLPPGSYTICLDITGPSGCIDSFCQTAVLNYTPACNTTFSYTPTGTGCDTYDFVINNSGPPLTTTDWFVNGSNVSTLPATQQTLNFATPPFNTGSVSVTGVANGPSCSSTWMATFVNPAYFYIDLDTTGSVNTWYGYPNTTSGITSVLWDFGDGTTSTLQYPTHIYAVAGTYTICQTITINGSCTYTYCFNQFFSRGSESNMISNFIVVGPNGINEPITNTMEIFPNPAFATVSIRSVSEIVELSIMDVSGKIIKVIYNPGITPIDVSFLQRGIYFLRIENVNQHVVVKKFVKGE